MAILKFGIYSFIGLLAFLTPITIGGESSIIMSHLKNFVLNNFSNWVNFLIIFCSVVTIFGTIIGFIKKDLKKLFLLLIVFYKKTFNNKNYFIKLMI